MALQDKSFLAQLPMQPGVYFMLGAAREILYIGKARSLKNRVSSYFNSTQHSIKTQRLLANTVEVEVTLTNTEHEALLLECTLIKQHQPKYNILLRDDKTYPYILLSNDNPYPRLSFYRGRRKSGLGTYFGPYANSYIVRETINLVQKIFNLRTCENNMFANRSRPCLQYQINLCSAPCVGLIAPDVYRQNVRHASLFLQGKNRAVIKYLQNKMAESAQELNFEVAAKIRDQLRDLTALKEQKVLTTKPENADVIGLARSPGMSCVEFSLIREGLLWNKQTYFTVCSAEDSAAEILAAVISQHYLQEKNLHTIPEKIIVAHSLPDQALLTQTLAINRCAQGKQGKVIICTKPNTVHKQWLLMASKNAELALKNRLLSKTQLKEKFLALQKSLGLAHGLKRIECFDISHHLGDATIASCVVFTPNGPLKTDYRYCNITGVTAGDDLAAMRQALMRRFTKYGVKVDLLILDGDFRHVALAQQVLTDLGIRCMPVLAVAKGVERKPGLETVYFNSRQALKLPPDSLALHLIQQIRDEAHRFAITQHRKKREHHCLTSELLAVPGLGKLKLKALLQHFGTKEIILAATVTQLQQVPGITQKLALGILALKHNKS